jgi:hypothetical protein
VRGWAAQARARVGLLGRLCRCRQRRHRSPERRVRGQHTKKAVPVGAWGRHQGRNAVDQLQQREVQFICLGATLVAAGLAVLLGAAVHQIDSLFTQPIHGKGRTGAIPQQAL